MLDRLTLIGLQFSLTYFPAELCSSHRRRPAWKYLVLVRLTILGNSRVNIYIEEGKKWNTLGVPLLKLLRSRKRSENLLHHSEVLSVVVSLKESEAEVELEGNTADAPNITGLSPT